MPNSNWKHAKKARRKESDTAIKRGRPNRVGVIVHQDRAVVLNRVPISITTGKELRFFEVLEWGDAISIYSPPYIEGKVPILSSAFALVDEVERMIDRCKRFKEKTNAQSS